MFTQLTRAQKLWVAAIIISALLFLGFSLLISTLFWSDGSAAGSGTFIPTDTPTPLPTATPTPIPPTTPQAVAKIDLKIRGGPGDDYQLLGYLPGGATVGITSRDQSGEWWQIETSLSPDGLGWIRAGDEFSEADHAANVSIALAPPTPTPVPPAQQTATAQAAPTAALEETLVARVAEKIIANMTATATQATAMPTSTATATQTPLATPTPTLSQQIQESGPLILGMLTSCLALITSSAGFVSTVLLSWRKEMRETRESIVELEKLKLEVREMQKDTQSGDDNDGNQAR